MSRKTVCKVTNFFCNCQIFTAFFVLLLRIKAQNIVNCRVKQPLATSVEHPGLPFGLRICG